MGDRYMKLQHDRNINVRLSRAGKRELINVAEKLDINFSSALRIAVDSFCQKNIETQRQDMDHYLITEIHRKTVESLHRPGKLTPRLKKAQA